MAGLPLKGGGDEYALKLDRLKNETDETAKEAIYAAANIVADKIADNLNALPEETFRRLTKGRKNLTVSRKIRKRT